MAFTFVHAADLHLDSPFEGLTADASSFPLVAQEARQATYRALDRIADLCIEKEADFLVLAGDVYDREFRSTRAQLAFHDAATRLAENGIRTFVVHGNHDPACEQLSILTWPSLVTVFDSEDVQTRVFETNSGDSVAVSGISYRTAKEKRRLHQRFAEPETPAFHVAVLHCSLASHPGREAYCECRLDELTERKVDYWALGHVHTRAVLSEYPHVVYPGNPQGREIRETGPRGCMVVRVDPSQGTVCADFHATDGVRWERADVSLDAVDTLDGVEGALLRTAEELREEAGGRDVIARIRLVARSPLFHALSDPDTLGDLRDRLREQGTMDRPFVWIEQLESKVAPPVDLATRAEERDLLGEILAYARSLETGEQLDAVLGAAAGELLQHARISRTIDAPDDRAWQEILDEARRLCVDLLEPR